jgi:hypothetical protein
VPAKSEYLQGREPTTSERQAPIDMFRFVDAVEEVIRAADSAKRQALAQTIDAYHDDHPEDFNLAIVGARQRFYTT